MEFESTWIIAILINKLGGTVSITDEEMATIPLTNKAIEAVRDEKTGSMIFRIIDAPEETDEVQ